MGVMHQLMIRPVQSRYGILYDGVISQLNSIYIGVVYNSLFHYHQIGKVTGFKAPRSHSGL